MIGAARLLLKQADEALRHERLEEAQRLLALPEATGHKSALPLLKEMARLLTERGHRRLSAGESESAWTDLLHAEATGTAGGEGERLRRGLTKRGLDQVRVVLAAGEPARAVEAVATLSERGVRGGEVDQIGEASRHWLLARELADRGDFVPAQESADRARKLLGAVVALDDFRTGLKRRHDIVSPLLVPLHAAAEQGRWGDVVQMTEKLLAAAPDHKEARRLRNLAWRSVDPAGHTRQPATPQTVAGAVAGSQRFRLWVDGVGGYLVCLGNRVTLGQAGPESTVDVPLAADVSRIHAAIVRDGEGYLLEPVRAAKVNDHPVGRVLLRPDDVITLGGLCKLAFKQPSPASASARLDVLSGHRLPLSLDGVLLMADTLVLGPGSRSHVHLPGAKEPVVLFRHKDGLAVRHAGRMTVDGRPATAKWPLGWAGTVAGEDFAFTVEPV